LFKPKIVRDVVLFEMRGNGRRTRERIDESDAARLAFHKLDVSVGNGNLDVTGSPAKATPAFQKQQWGINRRWSDFAAGHGQGFLKSESEVMRTQTAPAEAGSQVEVTRQSAK
jgi:hypothetical protein